MWTDGDPHVMPEAFAVVAPGVKPGAPFELPYHRGEGTVHVGWAVLPPRLPNFPRARQNASFRRSHTVTRSKMLDTAKYFRLDAFRETPLTTEPFPYLIVEGFVGPAALTAINADYPKVSSSGSFPVDEVSFGPAFQKLLDELESEEFRTAFEQKFAIGLSGRPTVTTVRGRCDSSDGRIANSKARSSPFSST